MGAEVIAAIISAIVAVIGTAASVGSNVATNKANLKSQEEANETNVRLSREANVAQALESEKSYNRSKATNQVALLRQAGMSHAGALNVLSGGGSYTPAPVNTAQVNSFQADSPFPDNALFGLSDIIASTGSNVAQRKLQKEQFNKQMQVQESQFNASYNEQKRLNDASIAKSNAETAQINYQTAMSKLQNNEDEYTAYGRLSARLNPADYDTAYAYISALKGGEDGEYINHPNVREQLESQWNLANSGKLTTAQTGKAKEETKSIKSARKIAERMSVLDDLLKRSQLDRESLEYDLLNRQFDHDSEIWKFTQDEMRHKVEMWTQELSKAKSEAEIAAIQADIQRECKKSNIDLTKVRNELATMNANMEVTARTTPGVDIFYNTLWYLTDPLGLSFKFTPN